MWVSDRVPLTSCQHAACLISVAWHKYYYLTPKGPLGAPADPCHVSAQAWRWALLTLASALKDCGGLPGAQNRCVLHQRASYVCENLAILHLIELAVRLHFIC